MPSAPRFAALRGFANTLPIVGKLILSLIRISNRIRSSDLVILSRVGGRTESPPRYSWFPALHFFDEYSHATVAYFRQIVVFW